VSPDPQVDVNLLEQTRKQINRLVEEIARLSEADLAPPEYYGEFLQRVLTAVAAPAGAVWVRTPQGHLQLQYQSNMHVVGLDRSETARQTHDELLRLATQMARPQMIPPHSGTGPTEDGKAAPGNPTDYVILMAPILVDKQIAGLVEVWQDADRNPQAQQGFLQFITRMAELASSYTRNHQLRQMVGQQTLWTQLETFARQIHGSLNPMEVGYQVANEGRRLVDCDRVSVGLRMGKKTKVEAVSGADVVEKRSNLIRLMVKLFEAVLLWGEKLVYQGTKDDSLPPAVIKALDEYLAESNSKLLVVLPLKDDRESESKKPPRSALLMECFDPAVAPEQLIARLEVVGRHATSALYNAAEHRRIPMRFIWMPIAKVQEGLGGKTRAILLSIAAAVLVLILVMVFVPYPLKMESKGQLLPTDRRYIFTPVDARVEQFLVVPGLPVSEGQPLVIMHDVELERKMVQLQGEISAADSEVGGLRLELQKAEEKDKLHLSADLKSKENTRDLKRLELDAIRERTNAVPGKFGFFELKSPINGTVLNGSFIEELTHRAVKPNEPILRVGNKVAGWQIKLEIPQKHVGQVLQAFGERKKERQKAEAAGKPTEAWAKHAGSDADDELDVDLVLRSAPTRTFKAKLAHRDIGGEATPNKDENNETEPVVVAWVRIDGPDIPAESSITQRDDLLVTGTEVLAKIRCGKHAMGYSLFYGVWEFLYEKVVFFF
jgi:hypothetical protein